MDLARDAGLLTGLFGKWHVGANPEGGPWELAPRMHGTQVWRGTPMNILSCGGSGYEDWLFTDGATSRIESRYQTAVVRDELYTFLAQGLAPKLAVWAPALAHGPFHRPPDEFLPPGWPATGDPRAQYESMIASFDLVLGQVLEQIDPASTYVIVVGDNGTPEQVAPEPSRAKTTTFERGIHVPLIVAGPGIAPGVEDRLVHVVDLLPTVADFLGLPAPAGIDGLSLFGPEHHGFVVCGAVDPTRGGIDQCARSERFKLRRSRTRRGAPLREELYDLRLDPEERVPIPPGSVAHQAVFSKHRAWLDAAF